MHNLRFIVQKLCKICICVHRSQTKTFIYKYYTAIVKLIGLQIYMYFFLAMILLFRELQYYLAVQTNFKIFSKFYHKKAFSL